MAGNLHRIMFETVDFVKLKQLQNDHIVQLFNHVPSEKFMRVMTCITKQRFKDKKNVSQNMSTELLLVIAGTRHVKKAIEKKGVGKFETKIQNKKSTINNNNSQKNEGYIYTEDDDDLQKLNLIKVRIQHLKMINKSNTKNELNEDEELEIEKSIIELM